MKTKSYKEQIRFLSHLHKDDIQRMMNSSFFYFTNEWPRFVTDTCDQYNLLPQKVAEDLIYYRSSFGFQKEKSSMIKQLSEQGLLA